MNMAIQTVRDTANTPPSVQTASGSGFSDTLGAALAQNNATSPRAEAVPPVRKAETRTTDGSTDGNASTKKNKDSAPQTGAAVAIAQLADPQAMAVPGLPVLQQAVVATPPASPQVFGVDAQTGTDNKSTGATISAPSSISAQASGAGFVGETVTGEASNAPSSAATPNPNMAGIQHRGAEQTATTAEALKGQALFTAEKAKVGASENTDAALPAQQANAVSPQAELTSTIQLQANSTAPVTHMANTASSAADAKISPAVAAGHSANGAGLTVPSTTASGSDGQSGGSGKNAGSGTGSGTDTGAAAHKDSGNALEVAPPPSEVPFGADAATMIHAVAAHADVPVTQVSPGFPAAQGSAAQPGTGDALAGSSGAAMIGSDAVAQAIQTARLVAMAHGTEMRVGVHSVDFGAVSIATTLSKDGLSAQIALDHAGLGQALAEHLPSMQDKLGDALGMQARVEVHDSAAASTGGERGASSQGGSAPGGGGQSGDGGRGTSNNASVSNWTSEGSIASTGYASVSGEGLSIHA